MDPKLEDASHAGDLDALQLLLQRDRLLLDRLTAIPTENPLHIAALLGHADFAREILQRKPGLARDFNTHGLSPMHLASASGNLSVVRELLNKVGSELCLLRDKDGLMPIHSAASKGRVHVLAVLMDTCPESARELTYSGDTVLHLAVKSNTFETVQLLVERIDGDEALNSKDDKGNTILHLAVARKQLQTTKLLLTQTGIDVNGLNFKGLTALDVLLESPSENGDLLLGEMIRNAGGNTAGQGVALQPSQTSTVTVSNPLTRPQSSSSWMWRFRQAAGWLGLPCASRTENRLDRQQAKPQSDEDNNIRGTLMVVATLIATITFQSGLSPPGGFDSKTGKAILSKKLNYFLIPDMIGLFASLSVILLFICGIPWRSSKQLTKTLLWVMWVAVYSTALAFTAAAFQIFPDSFMVIILLQCWFLILTIALLWIYLRFAVYLLRIGGWWKKKPGDEGNGVPQMGVALVMKRILVIIVVATTPFTILILGLVESNLIWFIGLQAVWFVVSSIPLFWAFIRLAIDMLQMVGWWKKTPREEESNAPRISVALVIKRILFLVIFAGAPLAVSYALHQFISYDVSWIGIFFRGWSLMFAVPILWLGHRFMIHLLWMVGWWKEPWDGQSNAQQRNGALVARRILAIAMVVVTIIVIGFLYIYLVGVIWSMFTFTD